MAVPLTPQDVQNKLFSSVRFKSGYDEDEVDAFLDEVEAEIRRLLSEIDRLSAEAERGRSTRFGGRAPLRDLGDTEAFGSPPAAEPAAPTPEPPVAPEPSAVAPLAAPAPVALPPIEPSPTEEALRRTLILAQRTADAAIAEARAEASALLAEARDQVAATERGAAAEHAARQRERERERDELMASVDELRSFEREYRSRLRAYLHLQLRDLDTHAPTEPASLRGGREAISGGATAPGAYPQGGRGGEVSWDPEAADDTTPSTSVGVTGGAEATLSNGTGGWTPAVDDEE
jgi:DivIVA domain-containing protein